MFNVALDDVRVLEHATIKVDIIAFSFRAYFEVFF
jgi:hypothetical protein